MNVLLKAAELPYRGINRVRRALYRAGVLRSRRLPRPVVSVGSIGAGGSGKTPAVIRIVKFLGERGLRPAVLTRGYGRTGREEGLIDALDAGRWGDEPVLIKQSANVDVIVGSKRYVNALRYLDRNDCDLFILDDGFQHLQIERDLDIVIEAAPEAFHREWLPALRDADVVISRRVRTTVPGDASGKPLFAFAGLADNRQFFDSLRRLGLTIAGTRSFPDHHRYRRDDLEAIDREARACGAEATITTEKDAVKVTRWSAGGLAGEATGAPLRYVARAEFEIDPAILERIAAVVRR